MKNQKQTKVEDLEYTVMPEVSGKPEPPSQKSQSAPPGGQPPKQKIPHHIVPDESGDHKWVKWVLIGGAVVVILAGLYFLFIGREDKAVQNETPEINITVPEQNNDPDNDGLSDSEENIQGTNPQKADTDGDGLADGDEVNIYKSDPLLVDTDNDTFDDGREVARGFSPIEASSEPASAEETSSWDERIAEFGLHDPTPATLKLKAQDEISGSTTTYINSAYDYTIEIPEFLEAREANGGRRVGIYVKGAKPDDENLSSDPIYIESAIKREEQAITDWLAEQYALGENDIESITANGLEAITAADIENEICNQGKTFIESGASVIILTLTCNESEQMSVLYYEIVGSFRFTE